MITPKLIKSPTSGIVGGLRTATKRCRGNSRFSAAFEIVGCFQHPEMLQHLKFRDVTILCQGQSSCNWSSDQCGSNVVLVSSDWIYRTIGHKLINPAACKMKVHFSIQIRSELTEVERIFLQCCILRNPISVHPEMALFRNLCVCLCVSARRSICGFICAVH